MTICNLDKIFRPRRVAVIGASDAPGEVGQIVLRNLVGHGFTGVVYPVNAKRESVQGITAYPNLAAVPHAPDLAVVCTPAAGVPELVDQCGRLGTLGVVILSAGFRETGEAGRHLEEQLRAAAARYSGLRIVGPNCLGIMVPSIGLNASFASGMPAPGRVAFVSQSGALCTSVLDWARAANIGFSHFHSIGNMLDVGIDDLLDYLAADPATDSVVLYVESINKARQFMEAVPLPVQRSDARDGPSRSAGSDRGDLLGEERRALRSGRDLGFVASENLAQLGRLAVAGDLGFGGDEKSVVVAVAIVEQHQLAVADGRHLAFVDLVRGLGGADADGQRDERGQAEHQVFVPHGLVLS